MFYIKGSLVIPPGGIIFSCPTKSFSLTRFFYNFYYFLKPLIKNSRIKYNTNGSAILIKNHFTL